MYNPGDRICHINEGSFWYVEILNTNNTGITCNIIGFQNKNLNVVDDNHFFEKRTMFLNGYINVTPDLEKQILRIIYEA